MADAGKFLAAGIIFMAALLLFQGFDDTGRFTDNYIGEWSDEGVFDGLTENSEGNLQVSNGETSGYYFSDPQNKGEITRMDDITAEVSGDTNSGDNVTVRTLDKNGNVLESKSFKLEKGLNSYDITTLNESATSYEIDIGLSGNEEITTFEVSGTVQGGQGFINSTVNEVFVLLLVVMAALIALKEGF